MFPDNSRIDFEVLFKAVMADTGGGTKVFSSVFHFQRQGPLPFPGLVDLPGMVSAFRTNILASWKAVNVVPTVMQSISARCVNDATDGGYVALYSDAGTVSGARGDSFDCVSATIYTALRGKSYRGSKHIGGVPESLYVSDRLTGGAVTLYTAYINATQTSLVDGSSNNYVASVLSRKLSQLRVNPTTVINTPANGYKLQHRVGTMRRRKTIGLLA